MIRVLHVLGALDRGGAETMVMNLYRNIDKKKVQFDFIIHTEKHCDYTDEIKALGGKIYSIPQYKGVNHLSYVYEWKHFFKNHPEYEIIHAHVRSTAAIFLSIAKRHGLFTIAHSHSTSSGNGITAHIKDTMQFPIRYVADYYLACSVKAGKWLFGNRVVTSNRFKVINNAIDTDNYVFSQEKREKIRNELHIPQNAFVIGHVGRFVDAKNHFFLIRVFEQIRALNNKALLVLVGEGELKNRIIDECEKRKISKSVIFTGVRNDVPDLLSALDIFVFPSLFEGLGIVAIEAQAAGLPVVCSDIMPQEANISELFHSVTLSESAEKWARLACSYQGMQRKDMSQTVRQAGYDIADTSKWLQQFYTRVNAKMLSRVG